MTSRLQFLQTTAGFAGSLILPKSLLAQNQNRFFFIRADSCIPTPYPSSWPFEHAIVDPKNSTTERTPSLVVTIGVR